MQKMLPKGKEIILGMSRDPRMGPLLMFGLGGIYTEALKDVSFRLAPLRENVALEMIMDIRATNCCAASAANRRPMCRLSLNACCACRSL